MKLVSKKNVVVGLGEIGMPICKVLSKNSVTIGYDLDKKLMNLTKMKKYENYKTHILHICIPFTKKFITNVKKLVKQFDPEILVIHSTISPSTTSNFNMYWIFQLSIVLLEVFIKEWNTILKDTPNSFLFQKMPQKNNLLLRNLKK